MSSNDIHDPNGFQQDVQRAIEKVKEKAEDGDVSEQDRDDIMAYVNSKYQFVTSDDGLGPATLRTRIGRLRIFAEATDKPLLDVDGRKEVSRIIGRMFPTLIRFDHCYHTAFKCDRQYLHQYENLWPYLRDLYQTPGVAETVKMEHIKDQGYYQGEITPIGPDIDFDAPHDRDQLSSEEPAIQT